MKNFVFLSILLFSTILLAQQNTLISESKSAQIKLNEEYSNLETSILTPDEFKVFKGLEFYPIDERFIVEATLVRTPNEKPFLMPTTTTRTPEYVKYGEAHFSIERVEMVPTVVEDI